MSAVSASKRQIVPKAYDMLMKRNKRIEELRWICRCEKIHFERELDSVSCGRSLLKEINPRACHSALEFNKAMEELERLDPEIPESVRGYRL